ncbi:MAG: DUF4397 domain-containing protein [Pseudomonadota bacterium]|nr:DUF4397 domain-containing protein [Pseudomonadota bacterium]
MSISIRLITLSLASLLLNGCFGSSKGDAEIRILNTSIDYSSIDLYLDDGNTNTRKIVGAATGTLGSYLGVGSNSYTVEFTSNNVQSSLKSVKEKLSKNTHRTYVAYGNSGKFGELEILEDQDKPSSSYTKVQLVDAAEDAGSVDVYLTDPSVAITNSSPTFSSVTGGSIASAGFVTISSGTYRIRVTAAGSQTDIRLDSVTGITFSSEEVLSIILTGTNGGVLVNGAVLPQQGTQTVISNPYARVRAAAGIPSGSNLTATLGGTNLLGAAAANTVSNYVLVTAGAQTLNLTLSGNTLAASTQTLTAGDDYTVLVTNGSAPALAGGTTTTLIADDNRYPSTSTYAKIKLVNAMSSGLGDPVSLNVNYTPVASAIALSSASPSTEVTAGTNSEIDTVDATTSTTLFTNTTATLNASGVYSLFMFGSGTAPIGALRINR